MTGLRTALLLTASLMLAALSGCFALSVNPLYETDDLVTEPILEGLWGDADDPGADSWQFTSREDGSYDLIIREENTLRVDPVRDGRFTAHLLAIGDALFLDLFPDEPDQGNDFFKSHVVPAHSFWRVNLEGNVLVIGAMDPAALDRAIAEGRVEIDHVRRDDMAVLTAPTPRLQRLVVDHFAELFDDGDRLVRLQ